MPRSVSMDAYEALGVSPTDSAATIRRTWREKVRALYPDVMHGVDIEAATRKLAALNDAYDALRWHHPDKAAGADRSGMPRKPQTKRRTAPRRKPATSPRPARGQALSALDQFVQAATSEALSGFAEAEQVFATRMARTLRRT